MKKRFLSIMVLVVYFFSQELSAKQVQCSDLFTKNEPVKLKATSKKDLTQIVDAVATYIENNGKLPNAEQIAAELDAPLETVETYLSRKTTPDIMGLAAIAKQNYPDVFKLYEKKMARVAAELLEANYELPTLAEIASELKISQKDLIAIYGGNKDLFLRISEYERESLNKILDILIKQYVKAAKQFGRSPTIEEVAAVTGSKFSVATLKEFVGSGRLVGDLNEIYSIIEKRNPKLLKGVVNLEVFNEKEFQDLMKDLKEGERLVITTGIAGATFSKDFLGALETYYKAEKAPLFIKPLNNETAGIDPIVHEKSFVHVLISEVELGTDLKISNIPLTAKQINPLTGLHRIGKRGQSVVVGSPKMHVDVVATKDNQYTHHMLMTTGSINDPKVYQGEQYISKRTDYLAEEDHFMGAVIIEKTSTSQGLVNVPGNGAFHIRHVEFIPEKRGFMDLNKFYTPEGVEVARAEAVSFGDTHVAQMEQKILPAIQKQILENLRPLRVFLDDLFDGRSISAYERDKIITLANKMEKGELDFEKELDFTVDYMRALIEAAPGDTVFYVKRSNHNDWISRYIESGQFMKEPINTKIGLELAQVKISGKEPLEYFFEKRLGSKLFKRIVFLKPGEAIYVGPEPTGKPGEKDRRVLMSEHGDRGANGAKGGLASFQKGADKVAYGHTHTYQRRNGTVNYGTTSLNPMPYAVGGFSNWVHGLLVVGANGEQQVLVYQNGEWYRNPNQQLPPPAEFFRQGYPYAKPNNEGTSAVQVDNYTTKRGSRK